MDLIDLHVHSTISDGTMTPTELVHYAKTKNLKAFSLTDHDTVEGLDEAIKEGEIHNIEIIPGVELAAEYGKEEIHILGYDIDFKSPSFQNELNYWQQARKNRNIKMVAALQSLGFQVSMEELIDVAHGKIITRAHYAKLLCNKGYTKDFKEAFNSYIGVGCPGYVKREIPSPSECIKMILKAHGIPVLAHPLLYKIPYEEIDSLVYRLKGYGLQGIEAIYSFYSPHQETAMKNLANRHGLSITGGSDFHGSNKPDIDLGIGKGNLRIPYDVLNKLRRKS